MLRGQLEIHSYTTQTDETQAQDYFEMILRNQTQGSQRLVCFSLSLSLSLSLCLSVSHSLSWSLSFLLLTRTSCWLPKVAVLIENSTSQESLLSLSNYVVYFLLLYKAVESGQIDLLALPGRVQPAAQESLQLATRCLVGQLAAHGQNFDHAKQDVDQTMRCRARDG